MSDFQAEIERLQREIEALKKQKNEIPSFSFSKIRDTDLEDLIDIKRVFYRDDIFNNWFDNSKSLNISEFEKDLEKLLNREKPFLHTYLEEDLKVKFIAPVLNMVNFSIPESEIRDFYEQPLRYETDKFIFNGTTDFVVAQGRRRAKKPYFFIQEFKQGKEFSDPEPQLLAEMIAGLELSNVSEFKGAFIIGSIWNFVILEKLGENKYQYFVSENFDSSKIEDLKAIYKNLVFIKNEILKRI
jgi:uncharacterized protein YfkK (UPF0435 family)